MVTCAPSNPASQLYRAASAKRHESGKLARAGDRAGASTLLLEAAGALRTAAGRDRELNLREQTLVIRKALDLEEQARLLSPPAANGTPAAPNSQHDRPDEPGRTTPRETDVAIESMMYRTSIAFDDLGGMEEIKREIQFSLGMLMARQPRDARLDVPTRYLLWGPPGTGKTMLAAAACTMLDGVFFDARLDALLSKYFGDSSRIISNLFERARLESLQGPVMIFFDEMDALCRKRGGEGEHGAERRVLSTLLTELDGLRAKGRSNRLVIVAATNLPWELDTAVLRRFSRRLYLGLPGHAARRSILGLQLKAQGLQLDSSFNIDGLAAMTKGFSGSELHSLVEMAQATMLQTANPDLLDRVRGGTIREYELRVRPLSARYFEQGLRGVRPVTTPEQLRRYHQWMRGRESPGTPAKEGSVP